MKPTECSPRDWRLYYHHTMMMHNKRGLVEVTVSDHILSIRGMGPDARWCKTPSHTLECCWPLPGAVNYDNRAYYVGRTARRQAQQSATLSHYFTTWGATLSTGHVNKRMLRALIEPDYMEAGAAIDEILCGNRVSAAINRDIIIGQELIVVYKGIEVGQLIEREGEFLFEHSLERDPRSKRAAFKLQKEGILCL